MNGKLETISNITYTRFCKLHNAPLPYLSLYQKKIVVGRGTIAFPFFL